MIPKATRIFIRIDPALKKSFEKAASQNYQTLSQFLIQAGIASVESARARGLSIKQPPTPVDGRKRRKAA